MHHLSLVSADAKMHWSGVPFATGRSHTDNDPPVLLNLTRPGLETLLRRLVLSSCPNVKYMQGSVTALTKSETSADAINSVRIRSRAGDEGTLPATLVVGKSSGCPILLAQSYCNANPKTVPALH
jgi:hypothetical protein